MVDQFFHAPWGDLYDFFARGEPPLAFQMLALNTVFFMLLMVRRLRGAYALRSQTATIVQSLLIFANALVLFHDYIRLPQF